ncbi:hypothetical protein UlMin_020484 [Ulmus minor]
MTSANAVAPFPLLPWFSSRTSNHLTLHCSMPRPPNRSRRKPKRTAFINPTNPSSSSSSSSSLSDSSDAKLQTSQFHYFLAAGKDAYADLQSLVTLDSDHHVVVSCRHSTFVVVFGFWVLVGLFRWVFKARFRSPITDNRMAGKDIAVDDIIHFIAGLAVNIGLENTRAARIVSSAVVAARTCSSFSQAWALEIQGKHVEEKLELSNICLVLRIFSPEESSLEMEMVAQSLEKHLKLEQREFLMNLFIGVCGDIVLTAF